MNRIISTIAILFVLLFSGCQGYNEEEKKTFEQTIQSYMKKNKIVLSPSNSGVYFKILKEGQGKEIRFNDEIFVSYTGKKMDGTTFDEKKSPIQLPLKNLIAAWKETLIGQKEGVEIELITPPQMAYGSKEMGDIASNSCLHFKINVIETR